MSIKQIKKIKLLKTALEGLDLCDFQKYTRKKSRQQLAFSLDN